MGKRKTLEDFKRAGMCIPITFKGTKKNTTKKNTTEQYHLIPNSFVPPGEMEGLTSKQQRLVVHWVNARRKPLAHLIRRTVQEPAKLALVCDTICDILLRK